METAQGDTAIDLSADGVQRQWDRPLLEYDGPNILAYNTQKLMRHEIFRLSGTVFDFRRIFPWLQLLFMVLVALIFAVYSAFRLRNGTNDAPETESWWVNLHTAQSTFNTLVIFLLGMASSNSYSRWWALRMALGNLQRDVTAFTTLVGVFMTSAAAADIRQDLGRYAQIMHALSYKTAVRNTDYTDLTANGLLRDNELILLKDAPQPAMVVVHWINVRLLTAVASNAMPCSETCLGDLQRFAIDMGGQCRTLVTNIETQLPFPYVHMLTLLVKVNLLLIACNQGEKSGAAFVANDQPWLILSFLQLALANFFFQGILHLLAILEKPLMSHPAHFPRHHYLESLRSNLAYLENNVCNVPFAASHVDGLRQFR